jgi:hypothetical protein
MEELFKSIQPHIQRNKYSHEMNEIINLVKERSKKEQRQILMLLQSLIDWKDGK